MAKLPQDDCTKRLAKIRELLEVLDDLRDKEAAVLDEIDAISSGKPSIADRMRMFEEAWNTLWLTRYQRAKRYEWTFTIDRAHTKRLLRTHGVTDLIARATRYLADPDPYLLREKHPYRVFVSHLNKYTDDGALAFDAERPSDCRHKPPCLTDTECTDRKSRERAEARA